MTATRVSTARMTPSNVKKLRSLWARRASIASLKVSEKATRLAGNTRLVTAPLWEPTPEEAGPPELLRLSKAVTPTADLRGQADTKSIRMQEPIRFAEMRGYADLDAAEWKCFALPLGSSDGW